MPFAWLNKKVLSVKVLNLVMRNILSRKRMEIGQKSCWLNPYQKSVKFYYLIQTNNIRPSKSLIEYFALIFSYFIHMGPTGVIFLEIGFMNVYWNILYRFVEVNSNTTFFSHIKAHKHWFILLNKHFGKSFCLSLNFKIMLLFNQSTYMIIEF